VERLAGRVTGKDVVAAGEPMCASTGISPQESGREQKDVRSTQRKAIKDSHLVL